jgi:peptidyl-prolyl cis-trans isomerase A (cyclophilin A)
MNRRLFALVLLSAAACGSPETNKGKDKEVKGEDGPNPVVVVKTSKGDIKAELFADKAPITVKNFLGYVDAKHYDGLIFHRVIKDFMIQGGGFKKGFGNARTLKQVEALKAQKDGKGIKNEAKKSGLSNERGTLAMARTGHPDSATDQFFINVVDNSHKLNPEKFSPDGYAVFGKVIDGMDVVDKIKAVKTRSLPILDPDGDPIFENVPAEDVVIESIRREEK